jgi:GMP synthase-like glutamine amidotransferase
MTKRFLVFQHLPWESPGAFLVESADRQGVELCVVEAWHHAIPDVCAYDGVIVLGGSPNVDQEKEYPFLKAEKAAIREALEKDMPYLGFCLGHQLLADALGARVGPNFCRSVGFTRGLLTKTGMVHPLFDSLPSNFPLFKWHAQAVLPPVPKTIQTLVTSSQCEVEAISVHGRPHVIGLQFDNHAASVNDAKTWVAGDHAWLSEPPPVDTDRLLADARQHEALLGEQFNVLFENYIKLVV